MYLNRVHGIYEDFSFLLEKVTRMRFGVVLFVWCVVVGVCMALSIPPPFAGDVVEGGMVEVLWRDVSVGYVGHGCHTVLAKVVQWVQRVESIVWQWERYGGVFTVGDVDLLQRVCEILMRELRCSSFCELRGGEGKREMIEGISRGLLLALDGA